MAISVGLLPLYLELYDRVLPEKRAGAERFYGAIAAALKKRGLEVATAPVCRLRDEVRRALKAFEDTGVDAVVTLHLAYSPSLEAADLLAATPLPLIVLDTTPTCDFGPGQHPDEIMYNHGIHGVQDLCNLLLRRGKVFTIEAGHWQKSDVLDRVGRRARSAMLLARLRLARVGLIGEPFRGMGDFSVSPGLLKETTGIETVLCRPDAIAPLLPAEDDPEVGAEVSSDRRRWGSKLLDPDAHVRSVRAGIAVRQWAEKERLSAFTMNFLSIDCSSVLPAVPFLEASKAMSRGIGYAGEGDVLTAALVGALAVAYGKTTFTEMFCPDWKNNSVFLSHMGEVNIDLVAGKPRLLSKPYPWTDVPAPVSVAGRLKAGKAVLVNLAPARDDSYVLIGAAGAMLPVKGQDRMVDSVRGWFRPAIPIRRFLEEYSRCGGTHHLALVYGDVAGEIEAFGKMAGWRTIILGG